MSEFCKPKVIVVDDEHLIADTLTTILSRAGYDARAVYSGDEAVEMALNFQPDLMLSDVVMPGITGVEAALQVRAKLPSCKILLFSGQAATADLLAKARAQNYEFEILDKPIHPSDLLAKLRSTVGERRAALVELAAYDQEIGL